MPIIDISPRLASGMPGWPGDTPFASAFTATIGPGCPVNVSRIEMSSHTGAHADAPLHVRAGATAIADLPLEPFLGPCRIVDVRAAKGGVIGAEDVLPALPARIERVVLRQYDVQPARWDAALKGLSVALVEALAARGVTLIGTDAASVDPADSKSLDAHHAINRAGIMIVEGLKLDGVAAGDYELIALPLAIAGCDGAPVRAVLRTLPRGVTHD